MRKVLCAILVVAIIAGFFFFGGEIYTEDGYPKIRFNLSWSHVGNMIGEAFGDLLNGIANGFMDSDFNADNDSTAPELNIPEIPEGSEFQIHYIDVGQADSILVACDEDYMLIDGGNDADGALVVSYLRNCGVDELDVVIGTHAHEDHIGGLDHVLNAFPAGEVWYPEYRHGTVNEKMFLEAAQRQEISVCQPAPGTTYILGSAICQVLGPISLDPDEPNNHSIVIRIVYGETAFLFTGDAELEEETEILDAGYDISCDVLKVGHHGAYTSTNYRWLRESAPACAVISVGIGNEYGHPTEGTLSRLQDAETTVYRTDLQGHIVCISDGINISFRVEKNADADTLTAS